MDGISRSLSNTRDWILTSTRDAGSEKSYWNHLQIYELASVVLHGYVSTFEQLEV